MTLLMALRWNWPNTLPIAAFCLWSIVAIGGGWTARADQSLLPAQQSGPLVALPADFPQTAATVALSAR